MPEIEVSDLCKTFYQGRQRQDLLRAINFHMAAGESIALLGRSGSGKSTLLNLIGGLDSADRGDITIDGQNLVKMTDAQRTLFRRYKIGFIYQLFHLLPTLTVAENVALPLELTGHHSTAALKAARTMLERVKLADRADYFPDKLSGGEQQRVAIARAIAHSPALILADEPTGNLDQETGNHILALLSQLVKEERINLLLVTHSLAVARSADRILTLEQGKLTERVGDFAW